mgnify:FL=1
MAKRGRPGKLAEADEVIVGRIEYRKEKLRAISEFLIGISRMVRDPSLKSRGCQILMEASTSLKEQAYKTNEEMLDLEERLKRRFRDRRRLAKRQVAA